MISIPEYHVILLGPDMGKHTNETGCSLFSTELKILCKDVNIHIHICLLNKEGHLLGVCEQQTEWKEKERSFGKQNNCRTIIQLQIISCNNDLQDN